MAQTAKQLAERIAKAVLERIQDKIMRFEAGDISAALTSEELDAVLKIQKVQAEANESDARSTHLSALNDAELTEMLTKLTNN